MTESFSVLRFSAPFSRATQMLYYRADLIWIRSRTNCLFNRFTEICFCGVKAKLESSNSISDRNLFRWINFYDEHEHKKAKRLFVMEESSETFMEGSRGKRQKSDKIIRSTASTINIATVCSVDRWEGSQKPTEKVKFITTRCGLSPPSTATDFDPKNSLTTLTCSMRAEWAYCSAMLRPKV